MQPKSSSTADLHSQSPGAGARKQIVIVDDHEVVREGMRLLIDTTTDLCVCGEAGDASQARKSVEAHRPDLVIVDLSLGETSGLELVKWLKSHHPAVCVIVASMHEEQLYGARALRAGAHGYVAKSRPARTILEGIRHVLAGELYFSKELAIDMMRQAAKGDDPRQSAIQLLSDREMDVFRRIGQGSTSKEIAAALSLSISTVDTYRERLKVKLGASHGAELAYLATCWVVENRFA